MDINRNNLDISGTAAPERSGLHNCQAEAEVEGLQAQHPGNVLVTTREYTPSFIPQHSLPQAVSESTPPLLLPSQMPKRQSNRKQSAWRITFLYKYSVPSLRKIARTSWSFCMEAPGWHTMKTMNP